MIPVHQSDSKLQNTKLKDIEEFLKESPKIDKDEFEGKEWLQYGKYICSQLEPMIGKKMER